MSGLAQRLHLIEAQEVTLASGAKERLIAFDGNDRPGVMLPEPPSAIARDHGVAAGRRIILFANNDRAYGVLEPVREWISAVVDRATTHRP